jgi:uncharacterized protein YdeI (YjbR/CyaY-like superfamily)
MGTRDPRIDDYIDKAAPFAQPILRHLREVIHRACPDVEETIKWGRPHFVHHGILCAVSAFKAHCTIFFWQGDNVVGRMRDDGMGQFGKITAVEDLPPATVLAGYVKKAAALNEAGAKPSWLEARGATPTRKPPVGVPDDLTAALATNAKARATFDAFAPSHRREYIEWITSAKQEATRQRRLATAVAQMAEGKSQNWKYERK